MGYCARRLVEREGRREAGRGVEGAVWRIETLILLWKMYRPGWKNMPKKIEEQENLGVRGSGAVACR